MRIIYFSPHLDDAVLSAGALIRAQADAGENVEIWTFMSGFPDSGELPQFAQVMHRIWGFGGAVEAVQMRRAENLRAAEQVGARAVHFDFLDCIYRWGRDGRALYDDVYAPIQPDDADLPSQLAQTMVAWLQPEDQIVCQLAIGHHVDHVVVRQAAEMLHRPLIYDADMPYLLDHPEELGPSTVGLSETVHPVSESGLQRWISAIECYHSQVDSVFGSHDAMHDRMQAFWQEHKGIRLWTPNTR